MFVDPKHLFTCFIDSASNFYTLCACMRMYMFFVSFVESLTSLFVLLWGSNRRFRRDACIASDCFYYTESYKCSGGMCVCVAVGLLLRMGSRACLFVLFASLFSAVSFHDSRDACHALCIDRAFLSFAYTILWLHFGVILISTHRRFCARTRHTHPEHAAFSIVTKSYNLHLRTTSSLYAFCCE